MNALLPNKYLDKKEEQRSPQPVEEPPNRFADMDVGEGYDFVKCRRE